MSRVVRRTYPSPAPSVLVAALVALAACSDPSSPPSPSVPEPGPAAAEDLALVGAAGDVATPSLDQAQSPVGGTMGCSYDAGRYTCGPSRTPDGMSFTRSWAYLDGDGQAQQRFDALLTASVNVTTRLVGTAPGVYENEHYARTVDARTDFTTSGLAGSETSRRVDGWRGASVEIVVTEGDRPRRESRVLADTVTGLLFPLAGGDRWPVAGRTVRAWRNVVTADGAETKVYFFREVVEYDGSSVAVAVIETDRGRWRCERNLAARTSRCTQQ